MDIFSLVLLKGLNSWGLGHFIWTSHSTSGLMLFTLSGLQGYNEIPLISKDSWNNLVLTDFQPYHYYTQSFGCNNVHKIELANLKLKSFTGGSLNQQIFSQNKSPNPLVFEAKSSDSNSTDSQNGSKKDSGSTEDSGSGNSSASTSASPEGQDSSTSTNTPPKDQQGTQDHQDQQGTQGQQKSDQNTQDSNDSKKSTKTDKNKKDKYKLNFKLPGKGILAGPLPSNKSASQQVQDTKNDISAKITQDEATRTQNANAYLKRVKQIHQDSRSIDPTKLVLQNKTLRTSKDNLYYYQRDFGNPEYDFQNSQHVADLNQLKKSLKSDSEMFEQGHVLKKELLRTRLDYDQLEAYLDTIDRFLNVIDPEAYSNPSENLMAQDVIRDHGNQLPAQDQDHIVFYLAQEGTFFNLLQKALLIEQGSTNAEYHPDIASVSLGSVPNLNHKSNLFLNPGNISGAGGTTDSSANGADSSTQDETKYTYEEVQGKLVLSPNVLAQANSVYGTDHPDLKVYYSGNDQTPDLAQKDLLEANEALKNTVVGQQEIGGTLKEVTLGDVLVHLKTLEAQVLQAQDDCTKLINAMSPSFNDSSTSLNLNRIYVALTNISDQIHSELYSQIFSVDVDLLSDESTYYNIDLDQLKSFYNFNSQSGKCDFLSLANLTLNDLHYYKITGNQYTTDPQTKDIVVQIDFNNPTSSYVEKLGTYYNYTPHTAPNSGYQPFVLNESLQNCLNIYPAAARDEGRYSEVFDRGIFKSWYFENAYKNPYDYIVRDVYAGFFYAKSDYQTPSSKTSYENYTRYNLTNIAPYVFKGPYSETYIDDFQGYIKNTDLVLNPSNFRLNLITDGKSSLQVIGRAFPYVPRDSYADLPGKCKTLLHIYHRLESRRVQLINLRSISAERPVLERIKQYEQRMHNILDQMNTILHRDPLGFQKIDDNGGEDSYYRNLRSANNLLYKDKLDSYPENSPKATESEIASWGVNSPIYNAESWATDPQILKENKDWVSENSSLTQSQNSLLKEVQDENTKFKNAIHEVYCAFKDYDKIVRCQIHKLDRLEGKGVSNANLNAVAHQASMSSTITGTDEDHPLDPLLSQENKILESNNPPAKEKSRLFMSAARELIDDPQFKDFLKEYVPIMNEAYDKAHPDTNNVANLAKTVFRDPAQLKGFYQFLKEQNQTKGSNDVKNSLSVDILVKDYLNSPIFKSIATFEGFHFPQDSGSNGQEKVDPAGLTDRAAKQYLDNLKQAQYDALTDYYSEVTDPKGIIKVSSILRQFDLASANDPNFYKAFDKTSLAGSNNAQVRNNIESRLDMLSENINNPKVASGTADAP